MALNEYREAIQELEASEKTEAVKIAAGALELQLRNAAWQDGFRAEAGELADRAERLVRQCEIILQPAIYA